MRNAHPGYAIVRVDLDVNDDEMRFAVVRVMPSEEQADAEVHRLQQVNAEKRCRYFWQYTRVVERPDSQGGVAAGCASARIHHVRPAM